MHPHQNTVLTRHNLEKKQILKLKKPYYEYNDSPELQ